jgi:DNA repair photolyase
MSLWLPKLFPFQTSAETIRAHHWRHFADIYLGCSFNCQYCLYKGPGDYGAHVQAVDQIEPAMPTAEIGILDIGATTDPYQHLEEREQRTRALLEHLSADRIPTFVLTRGTLVLRDIDILTDMSRHGLIEVCFSVISPREEVASAIEPGAPSPAERIQCATQLAELGIPVSFHVAPLIPGLDSDNDRSHLATELVRAGARHIFMAMLGARAPFWDSFLAALRSDDRIMTDWELFERSYGGPQLESGFAVTCDAEVAADAMAPFIAAAMAGGIPAVSENLPFYTTGPLEGGIYDYKLPTVYDMCEWIRTRSSAVTWEEFALDYYRTFSPSERLLSLVRTLWESGELFLGSGVALDNPRARSYLATDTIQSAATRTLVARRSST